MPISVSVRMNVDNNSEQVKQSFAVSSQQISQNIQRMASAIIDVSTTVQTLSFADIAGTAGYAYFRNVSKLGLVVNGTAQTNQVLISIGPMSGTNLVAFAELKPGEPAVIPLSRAVEIGVKQDDSLQGTNSTAAFSPARLHYAINGR